MLELTPAEYQELEAAFEKLSPEDQALLETATKAKVTDVLETGRNEVLIEEEIRLKALRSTTRMLQFAKSSTEHPRSWAID